MEGDQVMTEKGDLLESLREERGKHQLRPHYPERHPLDTDEYCVECGPPSDWPCVAARALDVAIGLGEQMLTVEIWMDCDRGQHGPGPSGGYTERLRSVREALTAAKKTWEEGR
jgi:hypothetical protein